MRTIGIILLAALLLACGTPTDNTNVSPPQISPSSAAPETPAPTSVIEPSATNAPATATSSNFVPTEALAPTLTTSVPISPTVTTGTEMTSPATSTPDAVAPTVPDGANVTRVSISGGPGSYSFSVTVQSPDTGCEQYADWWEVLSPEGDLIYRRVLLHSHVGEQPFTRSGGPIRIGSNDQVIVRAHMNTTGYGGLAFAGSAAQGLGPTTLNPGFASQVETQQPLPSGCAG